MQPEGIPGKGFNPVLPLQNVAVHFDFVFSLLMLPEHARESLGQARLGSLSFPPGAN